MDLGFGNRDAEPDSGRAGQKVTPYLTETNEEKSFNQADYTSIR